MACNDVVFLASVSSFPTCNKRTLWTDAKRPARTGNRASGQLRFAFERQKRSCRRVGLCDGCREKNRMGGAMASLLLNRQHKDKGSDPV